MKKLIFTVCMFALLVRPVSALEVSPPSVPDSGANLMPQETDSFLDGLLELIGAGVKQIMPDVAQAAGVCTAVSAMVLACSILGSFSGMSRKTAELVCSTAIAAMLLGQTNSLIRLGADTVTELSEYGRLLLPVMTTAMAAQGGVTTSTALFAGTSMFDSLLSSLIAKLLVPMIYLFLCLSAGNGAMGQDLLKQGRDFIKWLMTWCLKTILYVFTGYIGITGVISGTTDAAALKAAKLTISGMVPVVGGILSDASEAVLVSAGLMKNAAGLYGIFAILAVYLGPFLKIGVHYLILKLTASFCGVFGSKAVTDLIGDFSSAMGLLLAMTGSVCLMLLISTVCFLKGVG